MPIPSFEEYEKLNEVDTLTSDGDGGTETDTLDEEPSLKRVPDEPESREEDESGFWTDLITPSWGSSALMATGGLATGVGSYAFIKMKKFVNKFNNILDGDISLNSTLNMIKRNRGEVLTEAKNIIAKSKNVVIKHAALDKFKDTWKAVRMATDKTLSKKDARVVTKVLMSSKNPDQAVSRLNKLKNVGIPKEDIKNIEDTLFKKSKDGKTIVRKQFRDALQRGNTKIVKNRVAKAAYWASNHLPGRKLVGTLSKRVVAKVGAWGVTKLVGGALARVGAKAGLVASGVGTAVGVALVAADVYATATWLAGDKTMFEPEEGWSGGTHTKSGERKESAKSYEMMEDSIQLAVGIGKEAKNALAQAFGSNLIIGPPDAEDKPDFFEAATFNRYLDFLSHLLYKVIHDNDLIERLTNETESDDSLLELIKNEYRGYPINGRGGDDMELLDDIMTKYELNQETNIYGVAVAEDGGSGVVAWVEDVLDFIPGLNPLGWAHIFLSEGYIDSLDKIKDLDKKSILGVMHKSSKIVKFKNGNVDITKEDIPRIIAAITEEGSLNTDILNDLIVGELDSSKNLTSVGSLDSVIDTIVNHVNQSYGSIIEQNTKIPITDALMALSVTVAINEVLKLVVLGGATYVALVESIMLVAEELQDDVNKVFEKAGVEADKELEEEISDVSSEMDSDIEAERKAIEKESGEKVLASVEDEDVVKSSNVDAVKDAIESLPGFNDYIG